MRVESLRHVAGATPGLAQPCVAALLSGADAEAPPAWRERLDDILKARCAADFAADGGETADAAGTSSVAEWLGWWAVALQRSRGQPVFVPAALARADARHHVLRVPTVRGLHRLTQRLIVALADLMSAPTVSNHGLAPDRPATAALDEVLRELAAQKLPGKNRLLILEAAQRAGIPWERLDGRLYRLGHGARSRWFDSSMTDRTPGLAVALARDKARAAALLRRQGLPVPPHRLVGDEEQAVAAAAGLGYPVVVKPADRDGGAGVRAGLADEVALREAYAQARTHSARVLVERHVEGEDHRFHVFQDQVYRVRHRVPGGITGDGRSTVQELLDALNADPRRGPPGDRVDLARIDFDDDAREQLARQCSTLESVPEAGRFVGLRSIANVAAGGISLAVPLESVHPDNLELAVRAVRTLRLDLAAVDLLISDVSRSWLEVGAGICEVNAVPQFGVGAPEHILGTLFPDQGRIPIALLLGDAGPSWWQALRERAHRRGTRLGVAEASGLWCGLRRIAAAPAEGAYRACELLLGEPEVDALLARADSSLLEHGLPSDRIDAVLVADHAADPSSAPLAEQLAAAGARLCKASDAGAANALLDLLCGAAR